MSHTFEGGAAFALKSSFSTQRKRTSCTALLVPGTTLILERNGNCPRAMHAIIYMQSTPKIDLPDPTSQFSMGVRNRLHTCAAAIETD